MFRASNAGHPNTGRPDTGCPDPGRPAGLHRFNAATDSAAEAALLTCCRSPRWAQRVAAHRPYPDLDALLAASDEASYDLTPAEIVGALADEPSSTPPHSAPLAARTALRAAHDAYESSFGHAFVISLDGHHPDEYLDHVLAGIRTRLSHDPDHERAVAADELRRLARARILALLAPPPETGTPVPADGHHSSGPGPHSGSAYTANSADHAHRRRVPGCPGRPR
ncbi:2-oxo-4-hydroxy-4-carboxy-5-ureidoimidazoline decarboxylase [Streptomyces sp. NPDC088116]|uniref:2-oxo-4-hydroxy-4-carboxy-5-ureidoimidazoline decarboxylase n=1 Tax=Streptomyces sp. NPDC088116 TaxID=3365825 RepID=UPI0038096A7B